MPTSCSASRATRRSPTCRSRSTWSTSSGVRSSPASSPTRPSPIGAGGVFFQLGVIDVAAFERTWDAGVPMVMDTCPAIEWRRRRRTRGSVRDLRVAAGPGLPGGLTDPGRRAGRALLAIVRARGASRSTPPTAAWSCDVGPRRRPTVLTDGPATTGRRAALGHEAGRQQARSWWPPGTAPQHRNCGSPPRERLVDAGATGSAACAPRAGRGRRDQAGSRRAQVRRLEGQSARRGRAAESLRVRSAPD